MDFENPMGMGMSIGMGMTFENRYECGYSYTHPELAPCPSLTTNSDTTTRRKGRRKGRRRRQRQSEHIY